MSDYFFSSPHHDVTIDDYTSHPEQHARLISRAPILPRISSGLRPLEHVGQRTVLTQTHAHALP